VDFLSAGRISETSGSENVKMAQAHSIILGHEKNPGDRIPRINYWLAVPSAAPVSSTDSYLLEICLKSSGSFIPKWNAHGTVHATRQTDRATVQGTRTA
jgi:hypothetical protein